MDPMLASVLLSLLGAVLFFMGGYAVSKVREKSLSVAGDQEGTSRELQARIEVLESEKRKAEEEVERLRSELQEARASALRANSAQSSQSAPLGEDQAERVEWLEQRVRELEKSSVPVEEYERLEKKMKQAVLAEQATRQRVEELERHAEENELLRQQLLDYDRLKQSEQQLREQLAKVQAKEFSRQVSRAPERKKSVALQGEMTREKAMERQLDSLVRAGKSNSVVIADSHGFLLASAGTDDLHEELAVLSVLVRQLGEKTSELLPMGATRQLEIADENGTKIVSRLFGDDEQGVTLVAVGNRKLAAADPGMNHLVATVARIMEVEPA